MVAIAIARGFSCLISEPLEGLGVQPRVVGTIHNGSHTQYLNSTQ